MELINNPFFAIHQAFALLRKSQSYDPSAAGIRNRIPNRGSRFPDEQSFNGQNETIKAQTCDKRELNWGTRGLGEMRSPTKLHHSQTLSFFPGEFEGIARVQCTQAPLNAPFLNGLFSRRFPRGKTAHEGIRGNGPLRSENSPLRMGNAPLTLMGSFRAPHHGGKRPL